MSRVELPRHRVVLSAWAGAALWVGILGGLTLGAEGSRCWCCSPSPAWRSALAGLGGLPFAAAGLILGAIEADRRYQPPIGASGTDAIEPTFGLIVALPALLALMLGGWAIRRRLRPAPEHAPARDSRSTRRR